MSRQRALQEFQDFYYTIKSQQADGDISTAEAVSKFEARLPTVPRDRQFVFSFYCFRLCNCVLVRTLHQQFALKLLMYLN